MTGELEKEKTETVQSSEIFAQKIKGEIVGVDEKLDKLMTAYLENALSLAEYQTAKNKLVNQKQSLKDKLTAFEQKANNRFERAIQLINKSKQAKVLAQTDDIPSQRDFFQKLGSNFSIFNRRITFSPRGAWRIIRNDAGFGALRVPLSAPLYGSETDRNSEFEKMR